MIGGDKFIFLTLAIFIFNKKFGWWLFAGAIIMGLARVFVGVHWSSDILAGAIVGLGSAWLVRSIFYLKTDLPQVENI